MHVYVYVYVYIYIYISVYLYSSDHSTFGFGFPFVLKGASLTKNLPQNLYHTTFGGAAPKIWRANHLETPRFAKWMTDFVVLLSTCQFPNQRESKDVQVYRCLSSWNPRHDCLAYLLPWNTSHPGTRIEIERTPFSHVSVHNLKKINKVNHEIQVS